MTSRERIEAVLAHRRPDRTPVFEYVLLSPLADRFLGRRFAGSPGTWKDLVSERGWEDAVRQLATDRLDLACLLGHDMMYVVPNPPPPLAFQRGDLPPHGTGSEHSDDPVARVRRRNQDAEGSDPFDERILLVYTHLKDAMRARDVDVPILAPAYAHGIWTDVDLMQTMLLAPDVAHTHFELATRRSLRRIDAYIELGIDQIGVGGDFSGTHPLISPAAYRTFIVPQVRRLSRRIHQAGRYAINASDGNLWPVLDDFLFGCEVDGYLEIDMFAGMDMRKLKSVCGNNITLYGNLDCGNMLSFGSPADVREHTLDCLEAGSGSGHILCASNAITASVPIENYLAVVNAYRDTFALPRLENRF